MLSIRILNPSSAAGLLEYLAETVSSEQSVDHTLRSPMTRYFHAAGNAPGRWVGGGLAGVGLVDDWTVSSAALDRLFQEGTHPRDGSVLTAHSYIKHVPMEERVAREVARLSPSLSVEDRAAATAAIEAEQEAKRQRPSVSGFEMVFSPPKSFSVAWGLADVGLKEQLAEAHDQALRQTLAIMEEQYLRTRVGSGGVAQLQTRGAVAARYDHWNSRALDPHLHTHVLIANRVQGPDGRWRTIDSRGALLPAAVTLSEIYTSLLMDRVSEATGWQWENVKPDAAAKNARWEIDGVPSALVAEFSTRSTSIEAAVDALVADYVRSHGRRPSEDHLLRLRERARRDTAPRKEVHALSELTARWRSRAMALLGGDGSAWLRALQEAGSRYVEGGRKATWRADDVPADVVEELASGVLTALSEGRASWRRHNAAAEAERLTRHLRFASAGDRTLAVSLVVDAAVSRAIALTPPARLSAPIQFRTSDGHSAFHPAQSQLFTTHEVLEAERRLLGSLTTTADVPHVDERLVDDVLEDTRGLDEAQAAAVAAIAASGRQLDVLVGPAGTGKTTALRALLSTWTRAFGEGSVVGLAPSAVAAEVLSDSLGISTENTAKWLFEHSRNPAEWTFRRDQLVIVDEAGLAGTLGLDALRAQVAAAGAKLLLVGDPHQLTAIDAGGALGMLVRQLDGAAPTLESVWRFSAEWEALASLDLRLGRLEAIDRYEEHDRLHFADSATALDGAFDAWRVDTEAGLRSLLIADVQAQVDELNRRAQSWRLDTGQLGEGGDSASSGISRDMVVYIGDRVLARTNDRRLITARGSFVKNGQTWIVSKAFTDGSLVLVDDSGDSVTVGGEYARSSLDLAYAITTHRAQGSTVDTAHALVTAHSSRENAYVAMTRGRHANHLWMVTEADENDDPSWEAPRTARELLEGVISRSSAELAATELQIQEARRARSVHQLAAEYETLSAAASSPVWRDRLLTAGMPESVVERTVSSTAWDSLHAALRSAETAGYDITTSLDDLIAARAFDGSDPAAVLHFRVEQWVAHSRPALPPIPRILGLVPAAPKGALSEEMAVALREREVAMVARVDELIDASPRWVGAVDVDVARGDLRTVAAYRDRHGVAENDPRPLGPPPGSSRQHRADWRIARAAWARASGETETSRSGAGVVQDVDVAVSASPQRS